MSGNWNRTPRKGEKSINAVRSDQEYAVRVEYRNAGRLEGLVLAWAIANDYAERCERELGPGPAGPSKDESAAVFADLMSQQNAAREVALTIAEALLQDFPKQGRIALANAGAPLALVDAAENRAAQRRRLLAQAQGAARGMGSDDA